MLAWSFAVTIASAAELAMPIDVAFDGERPTAALEEALDDVAAQTDATVVVSVPVALDAPASAHREAAAHVERVVRRLERAGVDVVGQPSALGPLDEAVVLWTREALTPPAGFAVPDASAWPEVPAVVSEDGPHGQRVVARAPWLREVPLGAEVSHVADEAVGPTATDPLAARAERLDPEQVQVWTWSRPHPEDVGVRLVGPARVRAGDGAPALGSRATLPGGAVGDWVFSASDERAEIYRLDASDDAVHYRLVVPELGEAWTVVFPRALGRREVRLQGPWRIERSPWGAWVVTEHEPPVVDVPLDWRPERGRLRPAMGAVRRGGLSLPAARAARRVSLDDVAPGRLPEILGPLLVGLVWIDVPDK